VKIPILWSSDSTGADRLSNVNRKLVFQFHSLNLKTTYNTPSTYIMYSLRYKESITPEVIYVKITDRGKVVSVIKHQNMKICRGRGDKYPFILWISTRMWVVGFMVHRLTPGRHWLRGWVGPRAGLEVVAKRSYPCPFRESKCGRPTGCGVVLLHKLPRLFNLICTEWQNNFLWKFRENKV
jgi:hypothetical protein